MSIPQSPLNELIVTIEKKFHDTIRLDSGLELYQDTGFHPEEYAMMRARVVSIPRGIQDRHDYAGMSLGMQPGDDVLMRYDVVFAYRDQPERDTPRYKNILYYNGVEYWRADIQKIFAIYRPGGMAMINGYVMCEAIEETIESTGLLVIPDSCRIILRKDRMRVLRAGKAMPGQPQLDLKPGDIVYTHPMVAQSYTLDNQPFLIIKQSHIVGKEEYSKKVK